METLNLLFRQEASQYRTLDYLSVLRASAADRRHRLARDSSETSSTASSRPLDLQSATESAPCMNANWRELICGWFFEVVDHFDLSREIVAVAANHLDRCLTLAAEAELEITSRAFQLQAMVCIFLAIKLHATNWRMRIRGSQSTLETILILSRGTFSAAEVEAMEMDTLRRLGWLVHPPTPQTFLAYLLPMLRLPSDVEAEVYGHAHFLVELSTLDYFFVMHKPSEVAMAALQHAFDTVLPYHQMGVENLPGEIWSAFDDANVRTCQQRLDRSYLGYAEDAPETNSGSAMQAAGERNPAVSPVSVTSSMVSVERHC